MWRKSKSAGARPGSLLMKLSAITGASGRGLAVRVAMVLGGLLLAAPIGAAAGRETRPVNVSPGSPSGTLISERCPTFSWGGVEGAESNELVVYGVPHAFAVAEPEKLEKRLQVTLPRAAHSWTPPIEHCFEPGGRYAWALRAVTAEGASKWSEASLFEVSAVPSVVEVKEAMAVLRRYVQRQGEESAEEDGAPLSAARDPRAVAAGGRAERHLGAGLRALSSETVGAGLPPQGVGPPTSYSLTIEGALALGGYVFKRGRPFLHNVGLFYAGNTALGLDALINTSPGFDSTDLAGKRNTALGQQALRDNTSGRENTASGHEALRYNETGRRNTAVGRSALKVSVTGSSNTAVGARTLDRLDSLGVGGGSRNIAVGFRAGSTLEAGNDNIYLGNNTGSSFEFGKIRIGTAGTHTKTFIAGQVALGTSDTPSNQLVVKESINSTATPTNHVVLIENTSTGGSADVLALKVGESGQANIGPANNFITFFDGMNASMGAIQGNTNGVTLAGPGQDFAEYLPKRDALEVIRAADVVGVSSGRVSLSTRGAERVMVASTAPIVAGNHRWTAKDDEGPPDDHALVAFIGQVPVRVRGPVSEGDYLVASGRQDGTAVAVAALGWDQAPLLVGRALESSSERGESTVRTLVGLPETATLGAWAGELAAELRRIETQIESRLEKSQTQIESQQQALGELRVQLTRLEGRR